MGYVQGYVSVGEYVPRCRRWVTFEVEANIVMLKHVAFGWFCCVEGEEDHIVKERRSLYLVLVV